MYPGYSLSFRMLGAKLSPAPCVSGGKLSSLTSEPIEESLPMANWWVFYNIVPLHVWIYPLQ